MPRRGTKIFFRIGLDRCFAKQPDPRHCERSEAIQLLSHKAGLLRRFTPRNHGARYTRMTANAPTRVIASAAKQSSFARQAGIGQAGLLRRFAPSANAPRLSQAMTKYGADRKCADPRHCKRSEPIQ